MLTAPQGRLCPRTRGVAAAAICCLLGILLTARSAAASIVCPNEPFRTGPSAALPDCRAYELVTPADTDGRYLEPISTFGFGAPFDLFPTELTSSSGESVVYMTYGTPLRAPGEATGVFDLYQAQRAPTGWQTTRRLTPSGPQSVFTTPGGVSPDHRYAFVDVEALPAGLPGGSLAGEATIDYLSRPDGVIEPTGLGSLGEEPFAQGRFISEQGDHVIFSTGHDEATQSTWCARAGGKCKVLKLEPDAPPTGTGAVYDRSADGPTHVISLLPGDIAPAAGEEAFYQGSSADGSAVAFKIKGTLYIRIDDANTEKVTNSESTFAGISANGTEIFYVSGGDIHRFDTNTEEDVQCNSSGDAELVNVSADGSHVYFVSPSQLDGSKGTAGEPNMYVWSGGAPEYVTTVAPSDLERTSGTRPGIPALTRWTSYAVSPLKDIRRGPGADSSRTTPDGNTLVFESRAQLTAYDNAGHTEIYLYDDSTKSLECISCNPTVEPAVGDARLQELWLVDSPILLHNLINPGSRVFFETSEALVGRDTDGVNDVYEWQKGEAGNATVELISSGNSSEYAIAPEVTFEFKFVPTPNVLFSVTPDGSDVVFLSQDALAPGAPTGGTAAIYDARAGGGFPEPPPPPVCMEEGCRPPPTPPPSLAGPLSQQTAGSGNVKPPKRRCHRLRRQAKHRKRHRCTRNSGQSAMRSSGPPVVLSPEGSAATAPEAHGRPGLAEAPPAGRTNRVGGSALSTPSGGEFEEFGIEAVGAEESTAAAGGHPDFTTRLALNHFFDGEGRPQAKARVEDVSVSLPPGLIGNPTAIPSCSMGEFVAFANCPIDSQVGVSRVLVAGFGEFTEPVYNLAPPHPEKEVARLGFPAYLYPVFIDIHVRSAGDFGVTATVDDAPGLAPLLEAKTTLWGNPADPSHDEERLTAYEALVCNSGTACKASGGKRSSGLPPTSFMSNPSACQEGEVGFSVSSYQLPGQVFGKGAPMAPIVECQGLPFEPSFVAEPTNRRAGAPTGLKAVLQLPQHEDPEERSAATMREARVTLPEGMTIAAGAADGLDACSDRQVGFHEEVAAACPDASKLGTISIGSPALAKPLQGNLYQRTPTPGHLFGLWLVSDELGLHVKIPGEIKADQSTGRLTAIFADLPQVPVEEIELNVWGGPRAPLKNPEGCGVYATSFTFTPHSLDPPLSGQTQMTIDEGCDTGGFSPRLSAGVTKPVAGAFSPFLLDLARDDGEQNLAEVALTLPKGELAKLKGVSLCPDAAVATGACPTDSKIGSVTVAAGPGPQPLWLPQPGKAPTAVYLAGPYKGAPFSIVTVVPAQAGPFDLGVVTVRAGLYLDPETAQVVVKTDPLPQFIEGVAALYRRLYAVIDRPEFSLNPTNCKEQAVTSAITSAQGAVAHPSARFQVDGCKALGFKPHLGLRLRGGTKRGSYPALTATFNVRKGDANTARVSVALPHSEFLAQEHIVTICTRVQFAAARCPKGSVYGNAKAWTPLLDRPLEGKVYLRSSSHKLPDLVAALRGELDIDLVGRIDSHHGGIRTRFEAVPDAPVTRFVLRMKGGAKGLLVNSTDICQAQHHAAVAIQAQNGRRRRAHPSLDANCGRAG